MPKNAFYAQSGGVTAVINATACGVLETAQEYPSQVGRIFAGRNGIIGALHEDLIDTSLESPETIHGLLHTPSGAFGSCRYKLSSLEKNYAEFERLIEVFRAHDIGYFFYNGGGDSQDTTNKVAQMAAELNFPLQCIGIPKTIDNDLPYTDCCPGFGSVAKYVAISTLEASLDTASMCKSSTKVFILEVMGRHAGWIAASSGLAGNSDAEPPHVILFPENIFNPENFLAKVDFSVKQYGYCIVVASEGIKNIQNEFVAASNTKDAFGHTQLGGVAPFLANLVATELKLKNHWAVADYLQRAARHIASQVDVDQAYALGREAINLAIAGKTALMPTIVREADNPYKWSCGSIDLAKVANQEKKMPANFISSDGFGITTACRNYLAPLIVGEAYPPYKDGLPQYVKLNAKVIPKKLAAFA